MVVNMGGGTSQSAVVSLNGIVRANSVRIGGVRMNEAIMAYVRRKYNLMIGEMTAEKVKIRIGAALPLEEDKTIDVQGRDQVAGLPHRITVTSEEVAEALSEPLSAVIAMIKSMLEQTPPELSSDIIDRGMVLIGGGALLRGIDELISRETGVPAYVADAPMACVALGAGRGLEQLEILRRTVPDM
jgi:rod shape-determining protein MreB